MSAVKLLTKSDMNTIDSRVNDKDLTLNNIPLEANVINGDTYNSNPNSLNYDYSGYPSFLNKLKKNPKAYFTDNYIHDIDVNLNHSIKEQEKITDKNVVPLTNQNAGKVMASLNDYEPVKLLKKNYETVLNSKKINYGYLMKPTLKNNYKKLQTLDKGWIDSRYNPTVQFNPDTNQWKAVGIYKPMPDVKQLIKENEAITKKVNQIIKISQNV